MYKCTMRDHLGFMKDDKLTTGEDNKVIDFIRRYGVNISVDELENMSMFEIITPDGLCLLVEFL